MGKTNKILDETLHNTDDMHEDDCLFCKIAQGKLPSKKIYEDEDVLAFMDIRPVNPGHTLIIPKQHHRSFLEMPKHSIEKIFTTAQDITKAIIEGVGAEGVNIGMNIEKAAGQVVFHAHLHIMPRFSNDGHRLWDGKPYQDGQAEEIHKRITDKLKKKQ